ncbi:MAG: hypothetical protein LBG80_13715, partial [Bacteroidales bacterium]|nr:hypothetical protein [Bacteroidales bacterium]
GIACSDRANEVEPRPNEDDMLLEGWNNPLILTCHPYGILLTTDIFSTDISSLRDFLNATTEQSVTINAFLGRDCFAEPVPNEVWGLAMTALFRRLRASAHFQFSIFNFQLNKALSFLLYCLLAS